MRHKYSTQLDSCRTADPELLKQVSLGWLCTACGAETLRRNYALSTLYYFSEDNKELMDTFYV